MVKSYLQQQQKKSYFFGEFKFEFPTASRYFTKQSIINKLLIKKKEKQSFF